MAQVPKEMIDEAAKRGIVPGARVRCACNTDETFIVPEWSAFGELGGTISTDEDVDKTEDNGRTYPNYGYLKSDNRWATVITPAPSKEEEGLKEGDAVECGPAMRAAIKELAKELGLEYTQCHDGAGYIGMAIPKNGTIVHAGRIQEQDTTHTPEAFIAKMRITAAKPKPEPPIKISGHTVKFNTGSITVGCTTIPNATVKAIAQKLID